MLLDAFSQRYGVPPDIRSMLYADAWLRMPEFRAPPPDLPFYYRGPRCKIVPLSEPGLWLPLSCAIAWVAKVYATSATGGAVTTGTFDSSGANFIVVVAVGYNAINPVGNVTDNKSNTYTDLTTSGMANPLTNFVVKIAYKEAATVGSGHTVTFGAATTFPSVFVAAFSGVATSSAYDVENGAFTGSAQTTLATGTTGTLNDTDELLIAGLITYDAGVDTSSIDSGFTLDSHYPTVSGLSMGGALAYLVQAATTAQNPVFTVASSTSMAACIATFKAAAGGGGRTTKNTRAFPLGTEIGMNWRSAAA